ncbi:ubiquitin-like-specific protease ESD4-like isoform X1 [Hibiscus syriacus]|uniref:Ubiquitin-like-specific protease ESD4-like isoform X1 n=1 Tax=Hibiscus syriacus TaxID=106335 RepID=A0A6A3D060_HIBSY|nr:protein WHAT'S THIS FACTOR 1 homolog, chloroplastic-like [Hibiscus syriacus]KAE8734087.1 ubiquitin-like-specific protease ESD4-like isoform X1 [Hibiscus syriacus]
MLLSVSCQGGNVLSSSFLQSPNPSFITLGKNKTSFQNVYGKPRSSSLSVSCSSIKIVRSAPLDKHVVKQNKIRFVQKLKTLLLSKPKHFIPIHILAKCRAYLCVDKPRSILSMIYRYPTIFELFTIPMPETPLNATKSGYQLCVRLTPAAKSIAMRELSLKSAMSGFLANKLQKLLMLSSHRRLLLSKLVHLAPHLGLSPNFRSRLCNDHPDKFKVVDTSYGRGLELVDWDPELAVPMKSPPMDHGLIVDRPLKFKQLKLRKGLNLKRRHREFLMKFDEVPDVCPYNSSLEDFAMSFIEAEKRACGVVREVLGMMVEKRTLIDHLTHFRKEFGLPNKLRAMIVRHPELFYVSLKGMRDSVFLVEGFNDKGVLLEKDESLVIRDQLMALVAEGKQIRREKRKARIYGAIDGDHDSNDNVEVEDADYDDSDYDDGFENLFNSEDSDLDYDFHDDDSGSSMLYANGANAEFWTADFPFASNRNSGDDNRDSEPW